MKKPTLRNNYTPSPDKNMDTEARTIYDNAFGSFSEIPNAQNFTSLENTFSQQES